MESIFNFTTTATEYRLRLLLPGLAAIALVVGSLTAPASAADTAVPALNVPVTKPTPLAPIVRIARHEAVVPAPPAQEISAEGRVFCNGVRRQDEIVVVNTRMLCGSCDPESIRTGLVVEAYAICDEAGYRRWQPSDLERFLAFDPTVPTVFFIHGNQITPGYAKSEGLAVYRRLIDYGSSTGPIRFVIFSWPSGKVGGLLRDVRVKAARTDPAGCQLAWLLDQMPAETPVSLIGFSFGARIITGGLHILAGGSLGGLALAEHLHPDRAPVNVVMIAAALHAHWLGDGRYQGLAMTEVNQMFLLNNRADLAMRYYHLLDRRSRPQALGLCGPTCLAPDQAAKIRKRDVSRSAGSKHDLFRYLCAPGATGQIWDYAGGATAEIAN